MSQHLDARFQTNQVTVWRLGDRNPRGAASYVLVGVFGATWKSGSKVKRDSQGVEYVPKDIYYVATGAPINRGDLIVRGDRRNEQPSGDVVRSIDNYDNSFFGWAETLVVMTE